LCLLLPQTFSGCKKSDAGGSSPRQVVVYCTVDQDVAERLFAEFQKRTGIKVLARFDMETSKVVSMVEKLRSEAAQPVADVYWSGEPFHTARMASEGLLERYESAETQSWPKEYADPQGRWYGYALRARVLVYNTQRVKEAEAPARLEDLLDAKWRGRVVMSSPEFGSTSGHMASLFAFYGPARAKALLEGFRANQLRLVASNSMAVRKVANGEADLCITDTDDACSGRRNGWPVAMKNLKHAGAGPLLIPCTVALVKGGPHAAEARELMAYLLSAEVEKALAESDLHTLPIRPELAAEFPAYRIDGSLPVSYDAVAEALPEAIRTANRILK
jgi:iron(III) transport system substrate-binding protein